MSSQSEPLSSSECIERDYTTPNGLEFSVYCNQDQTNLYDIDHTGTDTVEECFNRCSTHSTYTCGAAAFNPAELQCAFKNSNASLSSTNSRNGWVLGLAHSDQLQPLTSACTQNGPNITVGNDLVFAVYCDQAAVGHDLCQDSSPECRTHADSIDECLDHCSTLHPLCTGVNFDAQLLHGWTNCYPKNGTERDLDGIRASSDQNQHCAKALLDPIPYECPSFPNGTVTASNAAVFELSCEQDRQGNNLTIEHAASLASCIDLCATHTDVGGGEGTEDDCRAVVFDSSMTNGYENCYLKSAIGSSVMDQSGFVFAAAVARPTSEQESNSQEQGRAWIAGPVAGTVAAVAVMLLGICWWRRRRRRQRSAGMMFGVRDYDSQGICQEPQLKHELPIEVGRRHELGTVTTTELESR